MSSAAASNSASARPSPAAGLTSVVIVAADSGSGLAECVARALASTAPVEVVVVDNASIDRSIDAVASRFAGDMRVRVLRNAHNLGFGSGCNRGAVVAGGDVLLFLNPDCELAPDVIRDLRAKITPSNGLLGVAIVDERRNPEPASRRRDPTLRRALMTLTGLARFEARWPALAGVALPRLPAPPDVESVDAVSGALMLVPRPVFDAIGGFDEGYFLHAEDLDLCRRVRDAGFQALGIAGTYGQSALSCAGVQWTVTSLHTDSVFHVMDASPVRGAWRPRAAPLAEPTQRFPQRWRQFQSLAE